MFVCFLNKYFTQKNPNPRKYRLISIKLTSANCLAASAVTLAASACVWTSLWVESLVSMGKPRSWPGPGPVLPRAPFWRHSA